ncbi:hypothetical protein CAPTEDRAFT_197313 [Capitella teleta]|uniref:Uncharacterized protein n=1 Tax=Capitella teleta TaxID=283909 RepID=R7TWL5_CAPTE|nr:hypothetical protein CAPTEDRAFT_197313 [Capitella teleta]|eukprot:ELT95365.1 hypothetical protein CAPTEDRAFT_197313 [Capitella teleta]
MADVSFSAGSDEECEILVGMVHDRLPREYAHQPIRIVESETSDENHSTTASEEESTAEEATENRLASRRSLKERQASLRRARQEFDYDTKGQTSMPSILDDVKSSLDQEAMELDKMRVSMSAGARILREKERKLLQMENTVSNADDDLDSLKLFEHRPLKSLHLSDMELTDSDESSGISSNDMADAGLNRVKGIKWAKRTSNGHMGKFEDEMNKMNSNLNRILGFLSVHNSPSGALSTGPPSGGFTTSPQPHLMPTSASFTPTPLSSMRPTNPYITEPQHHLDFGVRYESAEKSLEKKWKKYFGEQNAPIPVGSSSQFPGSYSFVHIDVRDQLRNMQSQMGRGSSVRFGASPAGGTASKSTEVMLHEHRQWLRNYQREMGLSPDGPHASSAVDNDLASLSESGGALTSGDLGSGAMRLELDTHDQLHLRHL